MLTPELARSVVSIIQPYLPALLSASETVAVGVGHEAGKELWNLAKRLWELMHERLATSPEASAAARNAAEFSDSTKARDVLETKLQAIFDSDPDLASQVAAMLQHAPAAAVSIVASGTRSVAVQSAIGSSIVTGDSAAPRDSRHEGGAGSQ